MCYKSLRLAWRPWIVEKKAHINHYLLATRLKLRTTENAANHFLPGQSFSAAELTRPTVTRIKYLCLKSQEEITAVTFTATFMYVSTELAEGCSEKQTFPIYCLGFWRSLRDLAHMNTKLPAQRSQPRYNLADSWSLGIWESNEEGVIASSKLAVLWHLWWVLQKSTEVGPHCLATIKIWIWFYFYLGSQN